LLLCNRNRLWRIRMSLILFNILLINEQDASHNNWDEEKDQQKEHEMVETIDPSFSLFSISELFLHSVYLIFKCLVLAYLCSETFLIVEPGEHVILLGDTFSLPDV
jgi:hypothetical protein